MIRDFRMENSQKNKKNDSKKNESKVFSQKFGIKVKPFGITKNEDENKCTLQFLSIIFKNKLKADQIIYYYY